MKDLYDNEVIRYKLDTTDFDKGIDKVIKSLEKIERTEYLKNIQSSLINISDQVEDVNFANMERGLMSIENRFSTSGVIAMSTIQGIVSGFINTAPIMAYNKLLGNMAEGFQELNLQIGATQTILSNTSDRFGTTLSEVNRGLDNLNDYADKTIYNFSEMTQAIGAFTAAGIDLGNSITAIKGVANMAAYVGADSNAAASGMYQFANSLGMGYMMLYQWNSLVYSGLGTKKLEEELISSARALGKNIDGILKEYGGSFRYSLQAGWVDSQVLMHTMAKYSGDVTEEQLKKMKYTEAEIKRILELGKTAENAATKVISYEKLIATLHETTSSGWARTFRLIVGDFEQGKELFSMMADNLMRVIDRSSDNRNTLIERWSELGGRDIVVKAIEDLLKTYDKLLITVGTALNQVFPPTTAEKLVKLTKLMGDFVSKLNPSSDGIIKITKVVRGFAAAVDIPIHFFKSLIRYAKDSIKPLKDFKTGWTDGLVKVSEYLYKLRNELVKNDTFYKKISVFGASIGKLKTKVQEFLDTLKKSDATKKLKAFIDTLIMRASLGKLGGLNDVIDKIRPAIEKLSNTFKQEDILAGLEKFVDIIVDISKRIYKFLQPAVLYAIDLVKKLFVIFNSAISNLANDFTFEKLFKILALIRSFIFIEKLTDAFGDFGWVVRTFMALGRGFATTIGLLGTALGEWQEQMRAETLLMYAGAIALLAASVFMLASIPEKDLLRGIGAIGVLFGILTGALTSMKTLLSVMTDWVAISFLPAILIAMALSITIMADALAKFEKIQFKSIIKGFIGLIGILTILSTFILVQSKLGGMSIFSAIGFLVLSSSLSVLAGSLKQFEEVNTGQILKAALAVGSLLAMIAIIGKGGVLGPKLMFLASSLTGIAASLVLLGISFKLLGELEFEAVLAGMQNLITMMASLFVVFKAGNTFTMAGIAKIALFSVVLMGLAHVFGKLQDEDPNKVLAISAAFALGILAFAGAMALLGPKVLAGAGIVLVLSAAIGAFGLALKSFEAVDFKAVLLGTVALGGFLVIAGLVGVVISPIIPVLMLFGAALILMTGSILVFGAGLFLFGKGIKFLVEAAELYIKIVDKFLDSILRNLPRLGRVVSEVFMMVINNLMNFVPQLIKLGTVITVAILNGILQVAPLLFNTFVAIMSLILDAVLVLGPKLNNVAFTLLLDMVKHLDENADVITAHWLSMLAKMFIAMGNGIDPVIAAAFIFTIKFIRSLNNNLKEKGPILIQELKALAITLLQFFVMGMYEATDVLDKGAEYLVKYFRSASVRKIYDNFNSLSVIGEMFVRGIVLGLFSSASLGLLSKGVKYVTDFMKNRTKAGLGEKSASKDGEAIGKDYILGISNGIDPKTLSTKLDKLRETLVSFATGTISPELNIAPVISPVMDAKALDKLKSALNSAFVDPVLDPYGLSFATAGVSTRQTVNNTEYHQHITAVQPLSNEEIHRRTASLLAQKDRRTNASESDNNQRL